jgi:enoyl-CoA hydratase/carnithine racemase
MGGLIVDTRVPDDVNARRENLVKEEAIPVNYEFILLDTKDRVATITMNRPERLNALNVQMGIEILDALEECEHDSDVRVLVLTGAGRGFCSGDDIKDMEDPSAPPGTARKYRDPSKQYVHGPGRWPTIVRRMAQLPKPIVGVINGHAHGAGFNLALGCDLRIMSEAATLAVPFVKWGMATGTNRLQQFVGIGKALEWGLLARRISPQEAKHWGLANWVVPHDELESATTELVSELAAGPTSAYGFTKHAVYHGWNHDPDTAYEYQGVAQHYARQSHDYEEGRIAFREKRSPQFTGE